MTTYNITGKELFDRMAAGEMFCIKTEDDDGTDSIRAIVDALCYPTIEPHKYEFFFATGSKYLAATDDDSKVELVSDNHSDPGTK